MKYDRTETAPSGKPRLCIYLGEDDAAIMEGLVKAALKHMPRTIQTQKTLAPAIHGAMLQENQRDQPNS